MYELNYIPGENGPKRNDKPAMSTSVNLEQSDEEYVSIMFPRRRAKSVEGYTRSVCRKLAMGRRNRK